MTIGFPKKNKIFSSKAFKALDLGQTILGIFTEFTKAFVTIDHGILLRKLIDFHAFDEKALKWFSGYWSFRFQCVQYKYCTSANISITCGVSQGSFLGPTCFISYIKDHLKQTVMVCV